MPLQLVESINDQLAADPITGIFGSKVWYVHDGRNAWHSTWVERYTQGCLHLSLLDAQLYCESLRTKGSVFYIHERPSIRIESDAGVLIVTEINSKNPLKSYTPTAIGPDFSRELIFSGISSANPLRLHADLVSAARSFRTTNPFWRSPVPESEAVILAWIERAALFTIYKAASGEVQVQDARVPNLLDNSQMYSYVSQPLGRNYMLGWTQKKSKVSQGGVLDALRRCGSLAGVINLGASAGEA